MLKTGIGNKKNIDSVKESNEKKIQKFLEGVSSDYEVLKVGTVEFEVKYDIDQFQVYFNEEVEEFGSTEDVLDFIKEKSNTNDKVMTGPDDFEKGEINSIMIRLKGNVSFIEDDEETTILIIGDKDEFDRAYDVVNNLKEDGKIELEEFYSRLEKEINKEKCGFIIDGTY